MQTRHTGPRVPAGPAPWQVHAAIGVLVLLFFRDILLRTSFFWEDFLYQYYAFRSFAAVSLAGGELPLWNPYTFNGMPFQADIQSAIFYLPNLALTLFAGGGALDYWWVELSLILHFVLAGSGMFLLGRSLGLDGWSSLFAALAYAFSGFMVGHLIHQGFIYQAAWLPLTFLTFRKAVLERSLRFAILSGLTLGHALLAGAPQVTLYIVLFLLLYTLFEGARALRSGGGAGAAVKMAPFAAVPVILAALVTAVQLLPTAELAPLSQRAELTYAKAAEGSFAPSQVVTLAVPKYFGASGARGATWQGPGAYWQYWETTGYIGVGALALAVLAVVAGRRDPLVLFLAGAIGFGFLYAIGDAFILHRAFHDFVPGFDSFRVPGRMVLYYCFAGSLLAGFGLRKAMELAAERPALLRRAALIAGAGAVVLALLGQSGAFLPSAGGAAAPSPAALEAAASTAASESLKAAGFLAGAAALLFLLARGSIARPLFLGAIVLLQFADLHAYGFEQNNGRVDPDAYFGRTAQMAAFFREEGKKEFFRVNSREGGAMLLDRNQGMLDRIFLMEGYTPLGLARFIPPMSDWSRTCDLMNAKYRIAVDREAGTMGMAEAAGYAPRAFFAGRARVAAGPDEAKAIIGDPGFDPMTEVVFEAPDLGEHRPVNAVDAGRPEGGAEGGTPDRSSPPIGATITSYRLNEIRLTVEAPTAGYLVLSEVWYPGWRATVDGAEAPVLRADWCLRAVPVEAGRREVILTFSPRSFTTGAWISTLAVVLSIAGLFLGRSKVNG